MYIKLAYLSTSSKFWAFIWKLYFEPLKFLIFYFNADPEPYPASKNNADPSGSATQQVRALLYLYQEAAGEEEEEDDLERSAQNTSQGSGEANKVRFLTTLISWPRECMCVR
jgi:hypothetical protein